jgi:two-component system, LytTR family, response regulator
MKAFLVDDEPLAVTRLRRLLEETGRIEIAGSSSDPSHALAELRRLRPDVLFLDVEMPEISGFELLEQLGEPQPLVVFTTAYDQYALDAFKVNSIDYLLKPVEPAQLDRALNKLDRVLGGSEARGDVNALLKQVRAMLSERTPEYLARVASRVGDRVEFVEVAQVTHFYAKDKLTFAVAAAKHHALDLSIAELEQKLSPQRWVRIHRSTLLNIDAVKELHSWFGGKLLVKLKDGQTELQVARERAAEVKAKLGI